MTDRAKGLDLARKLHALAINAGAATGEATNALDRLAALKEKWGLTDAEIQTRPTEKAAPMNADVPDWITESWSSANVARAEEVLRTRYNDECGRKPHLYGNYESLRGIWITIINNGRSKFEKLDADRIYERSLETMKQAVEHEMICWGQAYINPKGRFVAIAFMDSGELAREIERLDLELRRRALLPEGSPKHRKETEAFTKVLAALEKERGERKAGTVTAARTLPQG